MGVAAVRGWQGGRVWWVSSNGNWYTTIWVWCGFLFSLLSFNFVAVVVVVAAPLRLEKIVWHGDEGRWWALKQVIFGFHSVILLKIKSSYSIFNMSIACYKEIGWWGNSHNNVCKKSFYFFFAEARWVGGWVCVCVLRIYCRRTGVRRAIVAVETSLLGNSVFFSFQIEWNSRVSLSIMGCHIASIGAW